MLNKYYQKWQTLLPDKVKTPAFHLPPKIHKPNTRGRPLDLSTATRTKYLTRLNLLKR